MVNDSIRSIQSMRELFEVELVAVDTLELALAKVCKVLTTQKQQQKIFFVAGVITADGEEHIVANVERLRRHREMVEKAHNYEAAVFATPDIFTRSVREGIQTFLLHPLEREAIMQDFCRRLVESERFDAIYFTHGWERSAGARVEHEAAQRLSIPVIYLNSEERSSPHSASKAVPANKLS